MVVIYEQDMIYELSYFTINGHQRKPWKVQRLDAS